MKSKVASEAVKAMNPEMNITAFVEGVLPATEHIYDDIFFNALNGVVNALDNVKARKLFPSKKWAHPRATHLVKYFSQRWFGLWVPIISSQLMVFFLKKFRPMGWAESESIDICDS